MKKLLLLSFLSISLLGNRETCPLPPVGVSLEPLELIEGCVDVVSGAYIASVAEVVVNCHEPIQLYRQLISRNGDRPSYSYWQLGREFLDFSCPANTSKEGSIFQLIGEAGDIAKYKVDVKGISRSRWGFHHRGDPFSLTVDPEDGGANPFLEDLGGRTHPLNNALKYGLSSVAKWRHYGDDAFTLRKGSGELRIYTHERGLWMDYRDWAQKELGNDFGWWNIHRPAKQETFLLREVIRPNGNRVFYSYDAHNELVEIRSANGEDTQTFGWIRIADDPDDELKKLITTSDGQKVSYALVSCNRTHLLKEVQGPGKNVESFTYDSKLYGHFKNALISHSVQGRELRRVEYHQNLDPYFGSGEDSGRGGKVSSLLAPKAMPWSDKTLYEFYYSQRLTKVKDAEGETAVYKFDKEKRLRALEKWGCPERPTPYLWQDWDKRQITRRTIGGRNERWPEFIEASFTNKFVYDHRYNVTRVSLLGYLKGEGGLTLDEYITNYTYSNDGFNLPLSQTDGIRTIVNCYKPGTDLLIEQKVYEGDQLREEVKFDYDANAALILKTQRRGRLVFIEETKRRQDGMPLVVIRKTLQGQLDRTVFHYNERNQVVQTDHFDANDKLCYSLFTEFDDSFRVISQTDPLGRKTRYHFDPFGNPQATSVEGAKAEERFEHDLMNRLTKKIICDLATGQQQVEVYERDKMGREIARITPLGHRITFKRDTHGRIIEERQEPIRTPQGWQTPLVVRDYDPLDRVMAETDPLGGITQIAYTAR
ncbi:MAG: RHS repeat protein, partial [Verrucomicrobia bacterium]|nr:RHS repeat protein [Verrucomicrobiota bacterium]